MKTKHDRYIMTILKDSGELTKLYYNEKLNVYKELNKENKTIWYWVGMGLNEVISAYSHCLTTK